MRGTRNRLRAIQPSGKGFLTGMIGEHTTFDSSDIRSRIPRFTAEARVANRVLIDLLNKIGEQKDATPAQLALAWLLAQKPWIVPIPSSQKLERLDENLRGLAVELAADDLREIESGLSKIMVQGDRYPKDIIKLSGR